MYKEYLEERTLVDALWWFIENQSTMSSSDSNEVFFYLRERYHEKGC